MKYRIINEGGEVTTDTKEYKQIEHNYVYS